MRPIAAILPGQQVLPSRALGRADLANLSLTLCALLLVAGPIATQSLPRNQAIGMLGLAMAATALLAIRQETYAARGSSFALGFSSGVLVVMASQLLHLLNRAFGVDLLGELLSTPMRSQIATFSIDLTRDTLAACLVGLTVGCTTGMLFAVERSRVLRQVLPRTFLGLSAIYLLLAWAGSIVELGIWSEWLIVVTLSCVWLAAATSIGVVVGLEVSRSWSRSLHNALAILAEVGRYLAVMGKAMAAFALGYYLLVITFAAYFSVVVRVVPGQHFSNLGGDSRFNDFVQFSLMNISGLSYGGTEPTSPLAGFFVGMEVLAGTTWLVVVFAAFLAYVQTLLPAAQGAEAVANERDVALLESRVKLLTDELRDQRSLVDRMMRALEQERAAAAARHQELLVGLAGRGADQAPGRPDA